MTQSATFTLRDIQRLRAARKVWYGWGDATHVRAADGYVELPFWPKDVPGHTGVNTADEFAIWLDRQICKLGPNAPYIPGSAGDEGDNDENSDSESGQSGPDSPSAEDPGNEAGDDGEAGASDRTPGAAEGIADDASKGISGESSDADSGESNPKDGAPLNSDATADAHGDLTGVVGDGEPDHGEQATAGNQPDDSNMEDEIDADSQGSPDVSLTPRDSNGGQTAVIRTPDPKLNPDARSVRNSIRRLVQSLGDGATERGDRLCGRRLCKELVIGRWHLARATRRDSDIPQVLIACDVSGSCSAVSQETLDAATAIANEMENVTVAVHSNGEVCSIIRNGQTIIMDQGKPLMLDELAKDVRPALSIVFGDSDAIKAYAIMSQRGRLIWLDSFAASHGVAYKAGKAHLDRIALHDVKPEQYWFGVSSAKTAAFALRNS